MIPKSIFDLQQKSSFFYGHNFYKLLLPKLASELKIDFLLVGKYISDTKSIQAIVYVKENNQFVPLTYKLKDTPCEITSSTAYCFYEKGVAQLFPKDVLLEEMSIEGYVGASIQSNSSQSQGVFVALTHHPIEDIDTIGESLKLFTERIASELDREGVKILDPDIYNK